MLLSTTPLLAQERGLPVRLRGGFGFAGGGFSFDEQGNTFPASSAPRNDDSDAWFGQFEVEATTRKGIGGGFRFEGFKSDDDLFAPNSIPFEARSFSMFGHFTYRLEEHRFAMPLRVGFLLNNLQLENQFTGIETDYYSIGPYFELEPEVTLVRDGKFRWSLYGLFGVGIAATGIDIENDFREYDSASGFFNLEGGTRFAFDKFEMSIGYLGRFQTMDRSDVEANQVVLGYDAEFQGLFVGFGVVF
jgi:hypothetical protein